MTRWSERASQRLRDGESIEQTVPVGGNGVVVTTQRVLAFTPDGDGQNYRAVERPNVEGVSLGNTGDVEWFEYVLKGGVFGAAAIAVGLSVDFENFMAMPEISSSGAGGVGLGGMYSILGSMNRMLAMLDQVLLVGGLLLIVLALGAFGRYLESRAHVLAFDIAGDDEDLRVHAPKSADEELTELRDLLVLDDEERTQPHDEPIARPE